MLEFGILGPLEVRANGAAVALGGARPRAVFAVLGSANQAPLAMLIRGKKSGPSKMSPALTFVTLVIATVTGTRARVSGQASSHARAAPRARPDVRMSAA